MQTQSLAVLDNGAAAPKATNRKSAKPTGYVLYQDVNIAIIATLETTNDKTGDMVQVWIIPSDISPVEAVRTGKDDVVCFDCKHRGSIEILPDGTVRVVNRTCYVTVFQAPRAVFDGYTRGIYPVLDPRDYRFVFSGRKVRFGAYGETVLIPYGILAKIAFESDGWTGYTHQWRHEEFQHYKRFLAASVDSEAEYQEAKALGWRTFRVRTPNQPLLKHEIICPASAEGGYKSTCEKCRLCSGSLPVDPRRDIAIIVHGSSAKKFIQLSHSSLTTLRVSGDKKDMTTIYIYSNETGCQVAQHTAQDNAACEAWAEVNYGDVDYHWSYADQPVSNAVSPA